MKLWNYKTHEHEPFEAPEGAILFTVDMDKECACARCGKEMKFGEGYTSLEIHSSMGFGYCVCEDCHNEEIERRLKDERR